MGKFFNLSREDWLRVHLGFSDEDGQKLGIMCVVRNIFVKKFWDSLVSTTL